MNNYDEGYEEGLIDAKNIVSKLEQDYTCNRNLEFTNARDEAIEQVIYNAQKNLLYKIYEAIKKNTRNERA